MALILISPWSNPVPYQQNAKNYPYWQEVVDGLKELGHEVHQCGVNREGRVDCDNYLWDYPLPEIAKVINDYDLVVSIDNFMPHFCNLYRDKSKPTVVIYSRSSPDIFGYKDYINVFKDRKYFREDQYGVWEHCQYQTGAFVKPQVVLETIKGVLPQDAIALEAEEVTIVNQ